jgi:hypothetical protein
MAFTKCTHFYTYPLSLAMLLSVGFAYATPLGERSPVQGSVVGSPTTALPASKSIASFPSVRVMAQTSSLGSTYSVKTVISDVRTMKEYLNSDGVVFAVSWSGLGAPNFAELFGSYYTEYQAQVKARIPGRSRNRLHVEGASLVVSNLGHGSSMIGLAYVPSLLPPGVVPEDLQ